MKNIFVIGLVLLASLFVSNGASAQVSSKVNVTSTVEGAAVNVGEENIVTWESQNFPLGAFVHINLIKKISDNPTSYELVKRIADYSINDGIETWVPTKSDVGENLYVEVTCAGSARFPDGCESDVTLDSFAIETSLANNLANVFSAFFNGFLSIFR